nr:peptide 3b,Pro rich [Ovis aries]
VESYVPLFP